jgi:hypothetical protein
MFKLVRAENEEVNANVVTATKPSDTVVLEAPSTENPLPSIEERTETAEEAVEANETTEINKADVAKYDNDDDEHEHMKIDEV